MQAVAVSPSHTLIANSQPYLPENGRSHSHYLIGPSLLWRGLLLIAVAGLLSEPYQVFQNYTPPT